MKLDLLGIEENFNEFYNVLKALHIMCNLQLIKHNDQEVIDGFKTAWYAIVQKYLNVSTTPKIHILLDHLEDYFDLTNVTLKKVTDELCENMQQFLVRRLVRSMYYVKHVSNTNHRARLFRAVRHLNSYNICQ